MPPVEIQWCDHSSVLLEYLRQLYEEGRFVDVGLECEGRQVKAHKAVISACSPYLEVRNGKPVGIKNTLVATGLIGKGKLKRNKYEYQVYFSDTL